MRNLFALIFFAISVSAFAQTLSVTVHPYTNTPVQTNLTWNLHWQEQAPKLNTTLWKGRIESMLVGADTIFFVADSFTTWKKQIPCVRIRFFNSQTASWKRVQRLDTLAFAEDSTISTTWSQSIWFRVGEFSYRGEPRSSNSKQFSFPAHLFILQVQSIVVQSVQVRKVVDGSMSMPYSPYPFVQNCSVSISILQRPIWENP